jgi:hypothetical protein
MQNQPFQRNPKRPWLEVYEQRQAIRAFLGIKKPCFVRKIRHRRSLISGLVLLNRKNTFTLFVWNGRWHLGYIRADKFTVIQQNRFQLILNYRTNPKYGKPILIDNTYLKDFINKMEPCTNDQSRYLFEKFGLQQDTPQPQLNPNKKTEQIEEV